MNIFDSSITLFINRFSQVSPFFDALMILFSRSNILKGGVLISCICWLWFKPDRDQKNRRKHILSTIICACAAIIIARILAKTLPFRNRPLHEIRLDFLLPTGMEAGVLDGWSSFPSDHAVLFISLSFGLLYASKKMGLFALIYTMLIIIFHRIYLGLHYPTDILAGAWLGVTIAWICNLNMMTTLTSKTITPWISRKPQIFYTSFFLVLYQIADMFNGSRDFVRSCFNLLKPLFI